jgi:hypothetical protein
MEDFIFDDEVDDVGAEVEALCPKCKSDTTHVVVSKYEDEIRRVQCNTCSDVHSYRKPRGEPDDETAEPAASPKKKVKAKPTWDQVMAKSKKPPKPYALGDYFKEMEIISHPKFGVGYVTENIGDDKIEVTFKEDKRVLVHNRKGLTLPFSMLRPLAPPAPKGKGKKAAAAAAPAPAAVPKPVEKAKPKAAARPAAKRPARAAATVRKPAPKRPAKKATAHAARPVHARPAKPAAKKVTKKGR